jgi:predicted DNA-binding protein (UPF0251 family)
LEEVEALRAEIERVYSLEVVSALMGITTRTTLSYLKSGELKGRKVGGAWKITARNLQKFLDGE